MRVILLHSDNEIHINRFALALKKMGHDVVLQELCQLDEITEKDIDIENFDVCIICPIMLLPDKIEKKLPRNRVYISMAYDLLADLKIMGKSQKKSLLLQLQKCEAFICDSEHTKKELSSLVESPKAVLNIPYGIELETFPRLIVKKKSNDENIEIAALRNWYPAHNQSGILDAFEKLVENYPNIRLHIAGKGPEKAREAQRIKRLVDESVLIDHGAITNYQVNRILESSQIYISNATVDGTSVTLLEAMYLKCLCLVPDLPSNREWIDSGVNGFVFKSLETTLKESINLIENSNSIATIVQNAHDTVVTRASWERISREFVHFISNQCHA